ncbi:Protein-glutamine gamma-glutamyltransferase [Botrimarina colliarenosi]|uniref:Protein-glutamine gamma-glutamyltransferase n=1 Tax=Botrimarina colliarenosi TaxID=2528001 RepID=A0A5C6AIX6_9BACT|nr:transglutaminase family protein [Botrimarina colliarenosi]TWT98193.1 Protein-glutamine gamma-glutamyltransferase [Botrimarina colliarenosi]
MRYRIRHTTKYAYSDTVAVCHNLVRLAPRAFGGQSLDSYRLIVSPDPADLAKRIDAFGNRVEFFSIQRAHQTLTMTAISDVEVFEKPLTPVDSPPWETVRDAMSCRIDQEALRAYRYVFPSIHAPRHASLRDYAAASFTPGRPIVEASTEFTSRLHADFKYDPRATTVSTPVLEAFEARAGVCQDFAHVQIACLRSIGLAARYVSGYLRTIPPPGKKRLVGADASHAWIGVYCGADGWIDFDPTNDCIPATDHITIAIGRDYADISPIQGVFVGGGSHTMSVSVDVAPRDER